VLIYYGRNRKRSWRCWLTIYYALFVSYLPQIFFFWKRTSPMLMLSEGMFEKKLFLENLIEGKYFKFFKIIFTNWRWSFIFSRFSISTGYFIHLETFIFFCKVESCFQPGSYLIVFCDHKEIKWYCCGFSLQLFFLIFSRGKKNCVACFLLSPPLSFKYWVSNCLYLFSFLDK
jgi:hypothetical protein